MSRNKIITALLVFLLPLSIGILALNLKPILLNKLNELVEQDKNRLYDYSYDKIDFSILSGNLSLYGLKFKPRTHILDSLKENNESKKNIYAIQLNEFKIEGLDVFTFLISGYIYLDRISFTDPLVNMYVNETYFDSNIESDSNELQREKYFFDEVISSKLQEARIGTISLEGARLNVFNVDTDTTISFTSDSSNIHIQGIKVSRESLSTNELFEYDSSDIDLNSIKIYNVENYKIALGRFYKTSTKENLYLSNIEFSPLLGKEDFMKKMEFQQEWFKIFVKELKVNELDIAKYQKERSIHANSIEINKAEVEIYKDKRLKKKQIDYKPIIGKIIRNIKIPIHIPFTHLKNISIQYEEFEENAEKPLKVAFKEMDFKLHNFSTDSMTLENNDTLSINASGTFMNLGELKIDFQFNIEDTLDSFTSKGILSNLPLNELNPILKNSAFIMFTDGHLNFLEFDLYGNENDIKGYVDIDYEDLNNLQILRKKDEMVERRRRGKKEKSEKDLLSFIASNFAPVEFSKQSKNYKKGAVYYSRNKEKGIINLLINGIKTGTLDSFLHNHKKLLNKLKREKKGN